MNVQTKRWARPLALFIALTMVMMYSFGGVVFAQQEGDTEGDRTYKVTYNKGGATAKSYPAGTIVTVEDLPSKFNDVNLYGWELNGADTDLGQEDGTIYSPGDTFTMPTNAINFKLVKKSAPTETYTVTYMPGDHGDFLEVSHPNLDLGDTTPAAPETTGKDGYTFNGWSPEPTPTVEGNATYVAQWRANDETYTVTYKPGERGTFQETSTSGLTYGSETPTPPVITGHPDYTFNGWSPEPTPTVKGNATYVAQWRVNDQVQTYTVTFLPGTHGTFAATSTSGLVSGDPTPTPPAVTGQNNFTFTGWSPAVSNTVSGDAIYTAQWTQNQTNPGTTGGGGGTTITPTPTPLAEIPETETPLVEAPEVTLEEQPIPLADVPQTGDNTNIWLLLALMMGSGAGIVLLGRRKETVEK